MNISFMRIADYYIGIPVCFIIGVMSRLIQYINPGLKREGSPKNILLIKTWGIGNIIMMLDSMRALRKKFPDARIGFVTLENNRDIVEQNPYLDYKLLIHVNSFYKFILSTAGIILKMRSEGPDIALDFDQFSRYAAILAFFSGAESRIGFYTEGQGKHYLFTHPVVYNNHQHMSATFFDIVKRLGIQSNHSEITPVPLSEREKETAERFFKENKITNKDFLIGMHVGCGGNFPERRWPKERFAQLADVLIEKHHAKIILTGSPAEDPLVQSVLQLMKNSAVNICGRFNIRELSAIISRCNLFFSCDTGPLHLATAMGVPVVGFFGPNTPILYGPRGKSDTIFYKKQPCSPCITNYNAKRSDCKNPVCVLDITLEEVYREVKEKYL
ncbi:MAG: glycosyltransferase family 9 protein [Nitrospinae bacterium]|nr:glycosyltransferase family 9 protein [Nitrospinota bacterium]